MLFNCRIFKLNADIRLGTYRLNKNDTTFYVSEKHILPDFCCDLNIDIVCRFCYLCSTQCVTPKYLWEKIFRTLFIAVQLSVTLSLLQITPFAHNWWTVLRVVSAKYKLFAWFKKKFNRFWCRERARRRNCELDRGELSVVRLSPMKNKQRAVSLVRSSRPPPTLELDTVLEERSDPEQTTTSQVPYANFNYQLQFKRKFCSFY